VPGHAGDERTAGANLGRALDGAMGGGGADGEAAVVGADVGQPRDPLDVDQAPDTEQAFLEDEEQLGAAGVEGGVAPLAGQDVGRLGEGRRLVEREGPEPAQSAPAGRRICSAIICR
jgi:hypothetical protein